MGYLLGIDLGTSSLKAILADECGKVICISRQGYQFAAPRAGFAEQDPEEWWEACVRAVREVLGKSGLRGGELIGLSFSGQMHGLVALDGDMQPVRPAILHCDSRSGREVRELKERFGRGGVLDLMLNPVYTGFLLPSLLWVRRQEPEAFSRIRRVCLPKDFLKVRMTGELTTDYSDASATLAFDIPKGKWSEEILREVSLPLELFPPCMGATEIAGRVTEEAAKATGLPAGLLVSAGGGDQVMQQLGNGITAPGIASSNIGTSGQVSFQSLAPVRNPALSTNTFTGIAKDRFYTMGAIMSAGLSYSWLNGILREADPDAVREKIMEMEPGSGGVLFLPYLAGERTPHLDPDLRGGFLGLGLATDRAALAKAVMEGVTFALMQCMEVCGSLGLEADTVIASGGGARSAPWLAIQADVFNLPVKVALVQEQAGLGAAIAAGVGAGVYASAEEGCRKAVHYREELVLPDPGRHAKYMEYYRLYKEAFSANQAILDELTALNRNRD